jgi:hypothetical protein
LALASTAAPLTCSVFSAPLAAAEPDPAEPDPAGLDAEAGALVGAEAGAVVGAVLPLEDELEHAAALSATAAVPVATSMVIRIRMDISFADSCLFVRDRLIHVDFAVGPHGAPSGNGVSRAAAGGAGDPP